jgi:hypothetical protein
VKRARWRAALLIVVAAVIAAAALGFHRFETPQQKPTLLLLTSLPLMFGEQFSLEDGGSPALTALRQHYRVVPISVTSPAELSKGKLLLMAQPLAQTPENLVALDAWVRRGGRVLLLADPLLEWPSERPLGDPLRPPPMFMDTGLLQHWGLRLDAPEQRGPHMRRMAGHGILTVSPGELVGACDLGADLLVARCSLGHGQAVVVADADLLNVAYLGEKADRNLEALLAALANLADK